METPEITELLDIVRRATQQELLPRFGKIQRDYKSDRSIVTEADLAMQHGIRLELASRWDGFPMLGEEMPLQAQQALITNSTDGLWVVDPIDGTSNFAAGIPYWAVSVAWFHGGVAKLGLVYDPVRDEAFSAGLGQGARLNGQLIEPSLSPEQLSQTIAAIDFKRHRHWRHVWCKIIRTVHSAVSVRSPSIGVGLQPTGFISTCMANRISGITPQET